MTKLFKNTRIKTIKLLLIILAVIPFTFSECKFRPGGREKLLFNRDWKFCPGEIKGAEKSDFPDEKWRSLDLPHDWSIEGEFSPENPAGTAGGALPGGIGWYRKQFEVNNSDKEKLFFIEFDGIYQNSEVWINENYLGKRPNGYISFNYNLTPYLRFDNKVNTISVRVDNSLQPNSRWYTGSGIYRNVWLIKTGKTYVDAWKTFITTHEITKNEAEIKIETIIRNYSAEKKNVSLITVIRNMEGSIVFKKKYNEKVDSVIQSVQTYKISNHRLWTTNDPYLYTAEVKILNGNRITDNLITTFGIRNFRFDDDKGFFLNEKPIKIKGVNLHHDLGALGSAIHSRAIERQLEILKEMGCNAIRMAHNPPAPELLDFCDKMGFLVVNEAFDVWAKKKNKFDYHLDWKEWHNRDLKDFILRDRNHPSIIAWSIGNEIREQFDSSGISITCELADIVKKLDPTRPVTSGLTEQDPLKNFIYQSGALDLISFNYKHREYLRFPETYPGEKIIASENMSALATRGHYDFPSDSIRVWPEAYNKPFTGNPGFTSSSFDNAHALWGATHEDTWNTVGTNDFISGMFIWSGFDYLGEPFPYPWPARSSFFGVIDLCGFPKDAYYFYQSIWTEKPMLHIFPHWNWNKNQIIDVWAYYNQANQVELFLNNKSLGKKSKEPGKHHVMWRVNFEPGELRAISYNQEQKVLEKTIVTAGNPYAVVLIPDRNQISSDGFDLSFVTVKVTDEKGNLVPNASNNICFEVTGPGKIAGVDNGYQASLEPFKNNQRSLYNGLCLLIIQSTGKPGKIKVKATTDGLIPFETEIIAK